jgi:peptide/nickel transport system ATP-binding protein
MLEPRLLICDEAVSALDVSVQAQILNLLEDLRARFGLTMVFISHDLAVVRAVSDRVAVMYLGKLCELGPSIDLSDRPAHPYTALLQRSVPNADGAFLVESPEEAVEMPSPYDPPSGCRFRTRCALATERCALETPELREIRPGHFAACHFPLGA